MTISPLALAAKKVIDAAWLHGEAYDLSAQAAFALESTQMLQSPETAAELEGLRARVAELEARIHDAAMTRVWTNEDGKRFVFVEDIAPALLNLPHTTGSGSSAEASTDRLTALLAPTQALREDEAGGE